MLKTLVVSCLFLFSISCTKEYSQEGHVPVAETVSLFTTQIPDGHTLNDSAGGIELGMRFRSTVSGYIEGIRFYKSSGNTGTHTGQLYSFEGVLLASELFINETDTGWQTVLFAQKVPITANTTYIAAYHSSLGNYVSTAYGFSTGIENLPLIGLADGADGINGLYIYTDTPAFPSMGFHANNYWVDVVESANPVR